MWITRRSYEAALQWESQRSYRRGYGAALVDVAHEAATVGSPSLLSLGLFRVIKYLQERNRAEDMEELFGA